MEQLWLAIKYECGYQHERELSYWYSRRKFATDFYPRTFLGYISRGSR